MEEGAGRVEDEEPAVRAELGCGYQGSWGPEPTAVSRAWHIFMSPTPYNDSVSPTLGSPLVQLPTETKG